MKAARRAIYEPTTLRLVHAELERVLRCFGAARDQVTVIGGLVPGLLVADPVPEPHAGTADLDLCLTIALAEGQPGADAAGDGSGSDAAARLRAAGFRPSAARGKEFRWRGRAGIAVDFLYPAPPGEAPLAKVRTPLEWDPPAMAALGHDFAAMAVAHGPLVEATRQRVRFRPELDGHVVTKASVHVTGPGGLLALKCDALGAGGRREPKDAYDIVWLLDALDPAAAARATAKAVRDHPDAAADLATVLDHADDLFAAGARAARDYARFVAPPHDPPSATDERFATETVTAFTTAVRRNLR